MAADVALEISLLRSTNEALLGAFAALTHRLDGLNWGNPRLAHQQEVEIRQQRNRVEHEILRRMSLRSETRGCVVYDQPSSL